MVAGDRDIAPHGMLGISSAWCPRGVLQEDGLRRMRAHPNWEPVAACQPAEFWVNTQRLDSSPFVSLLPHSRLFNLRRYTAFVPDKNKMNVVKKKTYMHKFKLWPMNFCVDTLNRDAKRNLNCTNEKLDHQKLAPDLLFFYNQPSKLINLEETFLPSYIIHCVAQKTTAEKFLSIWMIVSVYK